jgi:hypothetical protein
MTGSPSDRASITLTQRRRSSGEEAVAAQRIQSHGAAETVVRQHIEAIDEGNFEAMAGCFAVPGSILDGLAAYLWHGPETHRNILGKWRIAARASAKGPPAIRG